MDDNKETINDSHDNFGTSGSPINWVPISLTHVEYPEGDWFGKLLALASLSPLVILVSFVTLIIFRRDLHTICFLSGNVINEIISLILKYTIRQPRPTLSKGILYTEYGMPSSHSQFMWFFAIYFSLFILIRLHHHNSSNPLDNAWKYISVLTFVIGAITVSYSRVYLEYHTTRQVIWGAVIGAIFAILWFFLIHFSLSPFFPMIASWPVCELFMIKDMSLISNVMWFEYTTNRNEARTRNRKQVSMKSK
ncbi:Dolichyldiphosphatase 1 [Nymphon striatum]|nr:Dolichyldiphosphatase 1 [Nymphon striatum]